MDAADPTLSAASTTLINVLLVEDDAAHAKLVRRAMREFDHVLSIRHVEDGHAALDALGAACRLGCGADSWTGASSGEERRYDLILLDLRLPGIDGFEVLRTLKSHDATRRIPIVIVSTSDRREEIERCYALGANAYVCKPIGFEEWLRKVRALASFWIHVAALPGR